MIVVLQNIRTFFFLLILTLLFSCEEKGDPITLDDIYEATNSNRVPFSSKINGFSFTGDVVAGGKEAQTYYFVGASYDGSSVTVRTIDISPGIYYGLDSSSNNILYKNAQGRQFSSIAPNKKPDAEISIRSFSPTNKLASGVFSSTLYSLDSEEELSITAGEFNSIYIDLPFLGNMNAEIDAEIFKSEDCTHNASQNNGEFTQIVLGFNSDRSKSIWLSIEDSVQIKSYDIADPKVLAKYNANTLSTDKNKYVYNGMSGSLNIVRIDQAEKKVFGNFGFEARNSMGEKISVKYGAFQALIR